MLSGVDTLRGLCTKRWSSLEAESGHWADLTADHLLEDLWCPETGLNVPQHLHCLLMPSTGQPLVGLRARHPRGAQSSLGSKAKPALNQEPDSLLPQHKLWLKVAGHAGAGMSVIWSTGVSVVCGCGVF